MFLVKREESRNFDMFFVFGREEKHVEDVQAESRTKGDLFFFLSEGCVGPFIAPAHLSRRRPFTTTSKTPWIGLILTPLERFWLPVSKKVWILKIQQLIESYGSRKIIVHRSVCYPGFRDISVVLTQISTHK